MITVMSVGRHTVCDSAGTNTFDNAIESESVTTPSQPLRRSKQFRRTPNRRNS